MQNIILESDENVKLFQKLVGIDDFESAKATLADLKLKQYLKNNLVVEPVKETKKCYIEEAIEDQVYHKAQEIIASGYEDSFYIMNLQVVKDRVQLWKDNLPGVRLHYAVKTNPDPLIIKQIKDLNCCFDCASMDEIRTVLKLGVKPSDIIFANPFKSEQGLTYAK